MDKLPDGQYRHGERHNCFFCGKWKQGCQYFFLPPDSPSTSSEYQKVAGQKFVICPECDARGPEFKATHLLSWINIQDKLSKYGVGPADIEAHKRTGRFPELKPPAGMVALEGQKRLPKPKRGRKRRR